MSESSSSIKNVLVEKRSFESPEVFKKQAKINSFDDYFRIYQRSIDDNEKFWAETAIERLTWDQEFKTVLQWNQPHAKWFQDGKINASYNCLDRHIKAGKASKNALIWEGEPGEVQSYTYQELFDEVCRCANGLKTFGLKPGDTVTLYMPMIPELLIATLACARLGLTHSVVFGGFSSEALASRIIDAKSSLIVTADGGFRRGTFIELSKNVDDAIDSVPFKCQILCVRRKGNVPPKKAENYVDWHTLLSTQKKECAHVQLDSEHPLFLLYTSGSTGKPKGILHSTAGYLLGANLSFDHIFDHKADDVFWCTADIGWITGHSYIVYGPLSCGATIVMYEGAPNYPDPSRFWKIIEDHKVSVFYTAPTAIRSFIKWGESHVTGHDLSSLRLLGTVGEPINPKAWMWYREKIGGNRCPIVDTWWQTETGSIMIAPLPGAISTTPGSATRPFFGIDADVVDSKGQSVPPNTGGYLVIKNPWPSMLRTIHGDDARYRAAYWEQIPGMYFTGDGARRDENGNFWIMGRIDDVLNVSGHRLATMEIESSLVSHKDVAEAAVVGKPDDIKGEVIHCFVVLQESCKEAKDSMSNALEAHVCKQIGAIAKPECIHFTESLPKTRSGKIMRRLLRDIAAGRETTGDISTLEDKNALDSLKVTR